MKHREEKLQKVLDLIAPLGKLGRFKEQADFLLVDLLQIAYRVSAVVFLRLGAICGFGRTTFWLVSRLERLKPTINNRARL